METTGRGIGCVDNELRKNIVTVDVTYEGCVKSLC